MNLYIMRHGETDWNKQGKLQGSVDIPLNDFGIELAEKTRDGFQREGITFDKVFSSPYIRAHKTAEIIVGAAELSIDVQPDIREMNFGGNEGAYVRELRTNPAYARLNKCFDDPVHYEPEG
ncbi:MAG: histidine phosphatase family protein, partial [Lachnospiraceae bacterium]|nr:histidine phosphatase family protein [Lachnospiraceae bacterium]